MANESRRRSDNVAGVLATTMSAASTTMKASALASLEAISSTEHAVIVIDPGRTAGAPETVYVTAHTASSTSASIQRAREGTSARTHSSTERWVHGPTRQDFALVCSSTSRPSAPFAGEVVFERDTKEFMGYDGAGWAPFSAGGLIGVGTASTAQTLTAAADLTGMSVSATLAANRRVKITGHVTFNNENAAVNRANIELRKVAGGSTNTQNIGVVPLGVNGASDELGTAVLNAVLTSTAGSVTYKLRGSASVYNVVTYVGSGPGLLIVEDLGPA